MRRKVEDQNKILARAKDILDSDLYSSAMINQIGQAIIQAITDSYKEGNIVNIGLGNTYLKLRRNNNKFTPVRTHSLVFRGIVDYSVAHPLIDSAMENDKLFETLYSTQGDNDESQK